MKKIFKLFNKLTIDNLIAIVGIIIVLLIGLLKIYFNEPNINLPTATNTGMNSPIIQGSNNINNISYGQKTIEDIQIITKNFTKPTCCMEWMFDVECKEGLFNEKKHKNNSYDIYEENIINIIYPYIKIKSNTLKEVKINKLINEILRDNGIYLDNTDYQVGDCVTRTMLLSFTKSYQIKNLIGLRLKYYHWGWGAAHGNTYIITLNINIENTSIFEFKDLFTTHGMHQIKKIVQTKLKNLGHSTEFTLKNNHTFYIKKDELYIVFDVGEVNCMAAGSIEISLKFNLIKELINKNGPLKSLF